MLGKAAVAPEERAIFNLPTLAEADLQKLLESLKIPFVAEFEVITKNGPRFIDFYLPDHKLAIEVDGGYHASSYRLRCDKLREREVAEALPGVQFVRFTNREVLCDVFDAEFFFWAVLADTGINLAPKKPRR